MLEEALRALALLQNDPRYLVWLKSEPARLSNPESTEYQVLFSPQLTGVMVVNAVHCYRAIRAVVLDNEQKARGKERLIYRHGNHMIITSMMKRLRARIGGAVALDGNAIAILIGQPLDQLRQDAFDLAQQRLHFEGPLAYFRNQGNVATFLADLMEKNYMLAADPAVPPLRNVSSAADIYPRKRLIDYLASRAPQL